MISLRTDNWKIENIDTVLFDKDGTFIDLHYFWGRMTELRVIEVMKRYNLPSETFFQLCDFLGYNVDTQKMNSNGITALYSRSKIIEIFSKNLSEMNIETSEKDIEEIFDEVNIVFYRDMFKYTKPIKEAIDFIKEVKNLGIKTGVITSDSVESTKLTIKHFLWENLFDVIVGRESLPYTKESGEPTKFALNELNSKPQNTLMIGDAPMDFISAKNAGIKNVILVATGQIEEEDLIKISPFTTKNLAKVCIGMQS